MKTLWPLRMELGFLILLLGVGLHFTGVFYGRTILVKKTPFIAKSGQYDVILGKGKLEKLVGEIPKGVKMNLDQVFVGQLSKPGKKSDESIYALKCSVSGFMRLDPKTGAFNPRLELQGLSVFSPFTIYSYLGVLLFTLGRLVFCYWRVVRKQSTDRKLLDTEIPAV